ncbi:MAG: hypothetical protein IPJ71_18635, partial [Bdellovibrionales bacterium]|nr:hypothetical protein [Bdellovibrionales bacterium]
MKPGDFIVLKLHGVGIYEGLKTMPIQGVPTEMIHCDIRTKIVSICLSIELGKFKNIRVPPILFLSI